MSRDRCCLREGWGRCSPTVCGGSDLWSGRLAGGAICGRSGLQVERLAGGAALGSGVVAGDVETSPLPRQAETNELARVDGEGCTVFPQTLTNPAHSPPSRRGGRRPGWCLRRRRQAAARPTARQRNRHPSSRFYSFLSHFTRKTRLQYNNYLLIFNNNDYKLLIINIQNIYTFLDNYMKFIYLCRVKSRPTSESRPPLIY